jgi:DnaJ-class molecular chaperone
MSDEEHKRYEEMAPGDEAPPGTEGAGEDVCPACGGSGEKDGSTCPECEGSGTVVRGVSGG